MKSSDKTRANLNYAKIRSAKNSRSIQQTEPSVPKTDHFYGYFGDNLNEKNMNYIQALKKPTHNKTFSYDYNYNKGLVSSPLEKVLHTDHLENLEEVEITETNGNEADIDEEEKAKINKSFSVEIVETHHTPEKNPSALYVGHLKKNSSQQKERKKSEFLHFIDETINYFEEYEKLATMPNNSVVSTKRKKMKNMHFSVHNDKSKSSHSRSQAVDELNSIYVIQNQKLIKSKKTIEELKHTQKTLIKEIMDHQKREKAYIDKLQEMEDEKCGILKDFEEMKKVLKITQELLAKEKIDNENSLYALKKTISDQRSSYKTSNQALYTKSQNNYYTGNDSSTESFTHINSKYGQKKPKDLNNISEVESNTLEISSDMEISYDKELYLMLKKLKHTQNNTITPKYHHYQRSLDSKKVCYTENNQNINNRKSFHNTSRNDNSTIRNSKTRDWFSLHLNSRSGVGPGKSFINSSYKEK